MEPRSETRPVSAPAHRVGAVGWLGGAVPRSVPRSRDDAQCPVGLPVSRFSPLDEGAVVTTRDAEREGSGHIACPESPSGGSGAARIEVGGWEWSRPPDHCRRSRWVTPSRISLLRSTTTTSRRSSPCSQPTTEANSRRTPAARSGASTRCARTGHRSSPGSRIWAPSSGRWRQTRDGVEVGEWHWYGKHVDGSEFAMRGVIVLGMDSSREAAAAVDHEALAGDIARRL